MTATPGDGCARPARAGEPGFAAQPTPARGPTQGHSPGALLAGRRVLFVDDSPPNRELLGAQLSTLGVRGVQASDAGAALRAWRDERFDLLITDCQMPEMDGYALTRAIRRLEREAGRPRTRVLGWTANHVAEERARCLGAGMDGFLTKPSNLSDLRETLERLFAADGPPVPATARPVDGPYEPQRSVPILDGNQLVRLAGAADEGLRRRLLESFAASASANMEALAAPVRGEQWAQIAALAHRLKGAARTAGAMALAGACEALERAARERSASSLECAWRETRAVWEALRRYLPPASGAG